MPTEHQAVIPPASRREAFRAYWTIPQLAGQVAQYVADLVSGNNPVIRGVAATRFCPEPDPLKSTRWAGNSGMRAVVAQELREAVAEHLLAAGYQYVQVEILADHPRSGWEFLVVVDFLGHSSPPLPAAAAEFLAAGFLVHRTSSW